MKLPFEQKPARSPAIRPGSRPVWLLYSVLGIFALFTPVVQAVTLLDPLPERSTTLFGRTVITIDDLNGDGVPDIVVAAPFQDGDFTALPESYGRPQNVGKVFVLDGATLATLSQLDDPEFALVQTQHFGGQLGNSLAAVADLDGDGVADIIAGVPHHIESPLTTEAEINAGKVLVFSGKTGALLVSLFDPTAEEDGKMGTAVAGLDDVDGDGTPDLLVGAPGKDIGGEEDGIANVGLAYVFSGKTGQVIRILNHPAQGGTEAGAAFGTAVANAGDLDHDGVSDVLIGAPGEGRVFVFSGKTGTLLFNLASPVNDPLPSFGSSLAGGKDLNRDGIPDFVVGAPLQGNLQGAVYVYSGSNGTLLRRLRPGNGQRYARFGAAVVLSDDVSGDRRADILVGAPDQDVGNVLHAGEVFVFDGARGKLLQSITSANPQVQAEFGSSVAAADFDHDKIATPVVGAPHQDANLDSVPHLQIGQIEIQP